MAVSTLQKSYLVLVIGYDNTLSCQIPFFLTFVAVLVFLVVMVTPWLASFDIPMFVRCMLEDYCTSQNAKQCD